MGRSVFPSTTEGLTTGAGFLQEGKGSGTDKQIYSCYSYKACTGRKTGGATVPGESRGCSSSPLLLLNVWL